MRTIGYQTSLPIEDPASLSDIDLPAAVTVFPGEVYRAPRERR